LIRQPSLSEHPARLLANASEDDFQGGREISGRGHFHRDCLQQAELLFARWIGGFSMFARFLVYLISVAHSRWSHCQRPTQRGGRLVAERAMNHLEKLFVIKRLNQESDCADLHREDPRRAIFVSCDHDDMSLWRYSA